MTISMFAPKMSSTEQSIFTNIVIFTILNSGTYNKAITTHNYSGNNRTITILNSSYNRAIYYYTKFHNYSYTINSSYNSNN